MAVPKFVTRYNAVTGEKTQIPQSWLDNPRLSKSFRKTPPAGKAPAEPQRTSTPPAAQTAPAQPRIDGDNQKKGK